MDILTELNKIKDQLSSEIHSIMKSSLKNDNGVLDIKSDPFQTKSFSRGKVMGLVTARDMIDKLIEANDTNKKPNKFKEVDSIDGYKVGDVIHIKRWFYPEGSSKFNKMGNSVMVDCIGKIDKITIDEETGKDTLYVGHCSTSSTDIANKGIVAKKLYKVIYENKSVCVTGYTIDEANKKFTNKIGYVSDRNVKEIDPNEISVDEMLNIIN